MKKRVINVQGADVAIVSREGQDYISLTDMLKAKDGDFSSRIGCATATPSSSWAFGSS